MDPIIIAICGAPKAGKTQIQTGLPKVAGPSEIRQRNCPDRFSYQEFLLGQQVVRFQWLAGSVLYWEEMFREVLKGTHLVLYVVSSVPISNETWQETMFLEYYAAAKALGKTWDDVPWLFVLNKIDRSVENPLIHLIPEKHRKDIIRCCATDGRGLDVLWQRIGEAVKSMS